MMRKIDVSIVIPSYNSEKTIDLCLKAITTQQTSINYEVIVVDSSLGEAVDHIATKYPDIIFIKEKSKVWSGTARNIGARQAKGELIAFIDADVTIPDDWLEKAFAYYQEGHNIFSASLDIWRKKGVNLFEKLEWFFEFSEFKPKMKGGTRWCLPSYALAIKNQLFAKNNFINMEHSHDTELTIRLCKKGNILHFNPWLKVSHIFYTSFSKLTRKVFLHGIHHMKVRKMHHVSGSYILTKNNFFAFFATPLFAIIKFMKISYRNIRYNNFPDKLLYIGMLPLVLLLFFSWMMGFYIGLFMEKIPEGPL